jgi:hypothetical protein
MFGCLRRRDRRVDGSNWPDTPLEVFLRGSGRVDCNRNQPQHLTIDFYRRRLDDATSPIQPAAACNRCMSVRVKTGLEDGFSRDCQSTFVFRRLDGLNSSIMSPIQ